MTVNKRWFTARDGYDFSRAERFATEAEARAHAEKLHAADKASPPTWPDKPARIVIGEIREILAPLPGKTKRESN